MYLRFSLNELILWTIFLVTVCMYKLSEQSKLSEPLWNDLMLQIPDPRVKGATCGLEFETSEFYICDPDKLLTAEEQAGLITALDHIHLTRSHECSDGMSAPLLITLVLASAAFGELERADGEPYADVFLERILMETVKSDGASALDSEFDPPPLSKCSNHLAFMIVPFDDPPISSIRCDNSLEPIFVESEYPQFLDKSLKAFMEGKENISAVKYPEQRLQFRNLLTLRTAANVSLPLEQPTVHSPGLAAQLHHLIDTIAADFPRTERKSLPTAYQLPIKQAAGKETLASVIRGIGGKYEESVGNLEIEAEQQIARVVHGELRPTESAPHFLRRHFKSLIIIASVLICWNGIVEILHQILLRRFSKPSDLDTTFLTSNYGPPNDEEQDLLHDRPLTARYSDSRHYSRYGPRSNSEHNNGSTPSVTSRPPREPLQPLSDSHSRSRRRDGFRNHRAAISPRTLFSETMSREHDV